MSHKKVTIKPGVFAPVLVPFRQGKNQEIDIDAFKAGIIRLANAGVGLVLSGTLGEATLLEREERRLLVQTARETLQEYGLEGKVPIVAGIGAGGLKETILYSKDAAEAGADAAIVVAPAYYAFVYGKNQAALKEFFISVADASPIPILLYNIPFAAGGIDLDADFLMDISEHQNIVGVKLTCYNISKGHRVALHVETQEYKARHPLPFLVLPGASDYLLAGVIARQHGCVAGPANLYPKLCVKVFELGLKAIESGNMSLLEEAQKLQDVITKADSVINRVGFLGIKTAMAIHVAPKMGIKDFNGDFRRPLPQANDFVNQNVTEGLKEVFEMEESL